METLSILNTTTIRRCVPLVCLMLQVHLLSINGVWYYRCLVTLFLLIITYWNCLIIYSMPVVIGFYSSSFFFLINYCPQIMIIRTFYNSTCWPVQYISFIHLFIWRLKWNWLIEKAKIRQPRQIANKRRNAKVGRETPKRKTSRKR